MMVGLEELALRCIDDESRSHIREAVKCYEGGAYRAAIISAYVAVCFDLVSKLKSLAAGGDTEAVALDAKLTNLRDLQNSGDASAVSGLLNFEKNLLEEFKSKFEFFGFNEYEELARLRSDRNRCAHPTFLISANAYNPPPELARLHIRNAIELVLSQEPKQGKAALEAIRSVILSAYFPKSELDAIERLKGSEFATARTSLINAAVDDLAFGWPTPGNPYYKKLPVIHSLIAAVEMHPNIAAVRVAKAMEKLLKNPDKDHIHLGAVLAVRIPVVGEMAGVTARLIIKNWIMSKDTKFRANAIKHAVKVSWLMPAALEAAETLTSDELEKSSNEVPQALLDRSAKIFSGVKSWSEANSVASSHAVKYADKYTAENVESVVKAAGTGKADLQGSGGFDRFLKAVASENAIGLDGLNEMLKNYNLEPITQPSQEDEEAA